jgi:thiopurine S-methyltransferase
MNLNREFWEGRYRQGQTGWDIGYPAPALTAYIDQLRRKDLRILVPGAGRGYEVAYLWQEGFHNLTVLDIAAQPLAAVREKVPELPGQALVQADFFAWAGGPFDLILEHTFFCALPPERRPDYARAMHGLLRDGGKLAGLLFDFPLTESGPPFGGSEAEYRELFGPYFKIRRLERATNSIPPRAGNELFFIFEKINTAPWTTQS